MQAVSSLSERSGATTAELLLNALVRHGHSHFTGVPCSLLKGLFRLLEEPDCPATYIPAPREDSALGVASGLAVAGASPVVLMQNSGLGYSLNVLTSFNLIYDVHLPIVVSWRGHGGNDAVEHDVIGRELTRLLDVFGLPWTVRTTNGPRTRSRRSSSSTTPAAAPPYSSSGKGCEPCWTSVTPSARCWSANRPP